MQTITPQRAERIARNINAMDIHFSYIDDGKKYGFWRDLRDKIFSILETLSDADKAIVESLCEKPNAEFFGLTQPAKETEIKKPKFRTQVFKRAYQIAKQTGKAFAVCLVKAWQVYRLKKKMAQGVAKFVFKKVDGTTRHAIGTLKNLTETNTERAQGAALKEPNYKTVAFFDVEKRAFRCFKVENLVSVF